MLQLLQARWHEHVAEALLLVDHARPEGLKLQTALMRHRWQRARLEAVVYSEAFGLPPDSKAGV
jgi:hypothetical protein